MFTEDIVKIEDPYSAPKSLLNERNDNSNIKPSFWSKLFISYICSSSLFFLISILITPEDPVWANIIAGFIFSIPATIISFFIPSNNKIIYVFGGFIFSAIGLFGIALYI